MSAFRNLIERSMKTVWEDGQDTDDMVVLARTVLRKLQRQNRIDKFEVNKDNEHQLSAYAYRKITGENTYRHVSCVINNKPVEVS